MSINDIITTLEKETANRISEINKQAEQEINSLRIEYDQRLAKAKERVLSSVRQKVQKEQDMKLFAEQSELKKQILNKKRRILDRVYQTALIELKNVSDEDYESIITKLMKKISPQGDILPAKGREGITKKVAHKISNNLNILSESIDSVGGFIWQSNSLNIDNTFEQIINDIRQETEIEVAKIIFENL